MTTAANPSGALQALLASVLTYARGRVLPTLAFLVLAAFLDGVGFVLLLPIVEAIFGQGDETARSGLSLRMLGILSAAGLSSQIGQLCAMLAMFLVLVAVRSAVLLRRDLLMMRLVHGYVDSERRRFFSALVHADWPVIKRFGKAELHSAMTLNIGRLAQAMQFFAGVATTLAMTVAALGAAFLVSPMLGAMLLALGLMGLAVALIAARHSLTSGERLNAAHFGGHKETMRFLDGLKTAKAARAERALEEGYAKRVREVRKSQIEFFLIQGRLRHGSQFAAALAICAILLIGFWGVGLSGGALLVMAAIVMRLSPHLIASYSGIQLVAHALPAFRTIREIEGQLAASRTGETAPHAKAASVPIAPLTFANASVRLIDQEGRSIETLRTGEMAINPGTLVHITGPSGSGKSSFMEMLAGLHLPAGGNVALGELHLSDATRRAWQSLVSFVPQEPFLFDGTVRENLLWPALEADDDAVWQALARAEAADLVKELPRGLHEPLLDGGARLSGGERQRLCLARALLRDYRLLILDEATSAVDSQLERKVVQNLRRTIGNSIILMVAHSNRIADLVDEQIHVSEGVAG